MEIWKPVPGFESHYEVSNMGRIRSRDRVVVRTGTRGTRQKRKGILLKLLKGKHTRGYVKVHLHAPPKNKYVTVHRLVAQAFLKKRKGRDCVDHIDRNRANNHVSNLRWVTSKQNAANNPNRVCRHCGRRP